MRLAFCVRSIYPQHGLGGLERAATAQITELLAQRVGVTLYTQPLPASLPFTVPGSSKGLLQVRMVPYTRLPLRANGIPARITNYRLFVEDMGRRVRSAAYSGRLDAVYAHGLCAYGVRRARQWGVPVIANPHGLEEFKVVEPLKRLAYAPFRRWIMEGCRLADRVVATDHAMRAEVAELLKIEPDRVVVVPSGVDLDAISTWVNESAQRQIAMRWPQLEPGRSPFVGISVGRLETNKGFAHLLEALSALSAQLESDWTWILVGEGSRREALMSRARDLGLGERILFVGAVSESLLHNLYARADLFAHPTLFEGSSLVTLEAMSHGLPVVASRVGGIPDKVVQGETGFLVSPGDARELAARLRFLITDPEGRSRMGRAGRERVATRFSWKQAVATLILTFEEVRSQRAACRPATRRSLSC